VPYFLVLLGQQQIRLILFPNHLLRLTGLMEALMCRGMIPKMHIGEQGAYCCRPVIPEMVHHEKPSQRVLGAYGATRCIANKEQKFFVLTQLQHVRVVKSGTEFGLAKLGKQPKWSEQPVGESVNLQPDVI
jgi:hypothetical protein